MTYGFICAILNIPTVCMKEDDVLARNKYPEETVQKILDVSHRLFISKGYDKTSIQDIVDELGMSKGAIYHHFKSKEEILDRLCDSIYEDMDWFCEIKNEPGLTALEKLSRMFLFELDDDRKVSLDAITAPIVRYNSRMIMESLHSAIEDVAPSIAAILEEGNRDGSLHVAQPREAAEMIMILMNVWISPIIFPVEKERFMEKVHFYKRLLDNIGIPLVDEGLLDVVSRYYDRISPGLIQDGE